MKNLIFILIDGLSELIAENKMGYLSSLEEGGLARKNVINSSIPSLSRPLYETILCGKNPVQHGILHNDNRSLSKQTTLFHLVAAAGGTSAAAAYHWISELYINGFENGFQNRFKLSSSSPDDVIHNGIFYYEDFYPDSHVFMDALFLLNTFKPNFTFIHTMNVDYSGHKYGVYSNEYSHSIRFIDGILSRTIPDLLEKGFEIIITSDHGMGEDNLHGGIHHLERKVPFWHIGNKKHDLPSSQTEILNFACECLEIQRLNDEKL